MKAYYPLTTILGFLGVIVAVFAWGCAAGHAHQPEDTLFFGTRMPMAMFGMIGYALIAITAFGVERNILPKVLKVINYILVAFAGLFTIYLVYRSVQVELVCPGCWCCWALNIVLVLLALANFFKFEPFPDL